MSEIDAKADCPCGWGKPYDECCGALHSGERKAATAEALMRARYSAYVAGQIPFIRESLHSSTSGDHDDGATESWSRRAEWLGLEVVSTEGGGEEDAKGIVEFIARYKQKDELIEHEERAVFVRDGERWAYLEGSTPVAETFVREAPKVGRNDPCPCGSGKKHKKCCG